MTVRRIEASHRSITLQIENLDDCKTVATTVAHYVRPPLAIALLGTLGAGKTQWTRFFAMELGADESSISSPTFVVVHKYASRPPIFHLDAYRIGDADELWELGIDEMLDQDAITIIEWADMFPEILPPNYLSIHIELAGSMTSRTIHISAKGNPAQTVVDQLSEVWK